jgi:sulfur oxidation c-type cytochrome SoxX
VLLYLTLAGYFSAPSAVSPAATGTVPVPSGQSASVIHGAQVFNANNCAACHRVSGTGGTIGPDLSNEATRNRSRDWLIAQIQNPKAHNPSSIMPPYPGISKKDLNDLVDYLLSLGTKSAGISMYWAVAVTNSSTNAAQGARVFNANNCAVCHRINGVGGTIGPDLSNEATRNRSRDWIITQIRNPAAHNPSTSMPAYSGISDSDLNALVDYLLSLFGDGGSCSTAERLLWRTGVHRP